MRAMRSRFAGIYLFGIVFLVASLLLRAALFIRTIPGADTRPAIVAGMFLVGLAFDVLACCCVALPVVLLLVALLVALPDGVLRARAFRVAGLAAYGLGVFGVLFDLPAEWYFWGEFGARFNFLAIDYLKNPQEVLGNIWQSYPVLPIVAAALLLAGSVVALTAGRVLRSYRSASTFRRRWPVGLAFAVAAGLTPLAMASPLARLFENHYTRGLSLNGPLSFAAAVFDLSVDYDQVFITRDDDDVLACLRDLLDDDGSRFLSDDPHDLRRQIVHPPARGRRNVMLIVVESLSAEFLEALGDLDGLTPNLDELAGQGLLFTRMYATGTRTIRGLEAINLSLPPSPGRAVAKRPDSDELFSADRVFRSSGYRTWLLYGGYGRFDSISEFFGKCGYETIDRSRFAADEVTFETAWGVCDEDLYARALKEADRSHQAARPFLGLALTVSNHAPFTFPRGADTPWEPGKQGAIRYTDHAIGGFIRQARRKPWFADTLFVIIADHGARHWGLDDTAVARFHIPMLIYAPGLIDPGRNDTLCSQIDVMPTLLRLLGVSYSTKFFGRDILSTPPNRALFGTHEKLGLLAGDRAVVLLPRREAAGYRVGPGGSETPVAPDADVLHDAVTYYQGAGYLLQHRLYNAE